MSKKKQIIFSSLLGIVLLVVIFMPKKETTEPLDEIEVTDSLEVKEITYKYGIPIDDYDVDMVLSKGIKVFLRYCRNMAYRWEKCIGW